MKLKALLQALACVALVAAVAQAQGHPMPAPAPAPAHAEHLGAPDASAMDDFAWLDDDGDMTWSDDDGDRKVIVRRNIMRTPGNGHGMQGGMRMRGGMGMGEGMHGGMGMKMMHMRLGQLGLSDTQRDRIQAIHDTHARKGIQLRADLQLARLDLHKAMRSHNPSTSAAYAGIDKVHRLMADMQKDRFATHMEVRSVLSAEQLKKLHEPMKMEMHGPEGMMHHDGDGKGSQ